MSLHLSKNYAMNWQILIPFVVIVISLLAFLIVRNQKDKEQYEKQLNTNYPKSKKDDGDEEMEED